MPNLIQILVAITVVGALTGLFVLGYWLNRRTKKPAGCAELDAACQTCNIEGCAVKIATPNLAETNEVKNHD